MRSHRRRVPYGLFRTRTTTVRSHHRRRPGGVPIIGIAVAILVILLLIAIF